MTNFVFWGFSALFICCDITGKPKWMIQYKIQEANMPVSNSWELLLSVV